MASTYDEIQAVEDSLQAAQVFKNPLSGQSCHSDSYMTIVDYAALESWYGGQAFTNLADCIDYWLSNPNMQPPLRQVAFYLKRKTVTA